MKFKSLFSLILITLSLAANTVNVPIPQLLAMVLNQQGAQLLQACKQAQQFACGTDGHIFCNATTCLNRAQNLSQQEKNCLLAVYQKECEENQKGRYVFVHGQDFNYEWLSQLYKMLYEVTQNSSITNHEFVRFYHPTGINISKEQQRHDHLMKYGSPYQGGTCRALFMNAALFGRYGDTVGCFWLRRNQNYYHPSSDKHSTEFIFKKFNKENLFKKYKQQLDQLKAEHDKLTQNGRILVYSMTKNYVQKHVFLCGMGGHKTPVHLKNAKSTDNVCTYIDQLKNSPHNISDTDWPEFCLVLSKHETIKPSPDCQVFSFNDIDAQTWKNFNQKRDTLFAQIKKDILKAA